MKLFHGSIRKKLIILVLLATTPALLVFLGTEMVYRQQAAKLAEKDLATYLHSFTAIQERITNSTQTLLRTVASIPAIQNCNIEEAQVILATLLETNPIYTNVILLDLKGDVIAAGKNPEKTLGLNFSDRKQFKGAISAAGFATGEFVVGKSSQKAIFPFGMAILDKNGRAKGALIIGVKLDHYGELFKKGSFHTENFFGLCDVKGLRLYRQPSNEQSMIGMPIKEKVFKAVNTSQETGSLIATASDGLKRIIVFEALRLKDADRPYMYMFMGLDYSQIQNQKDSNLLRAALTSLMTLTVAIFIAWIIGGRGLANRMDKLSKATEKFSHGARNISSGIDYNDGEVGALAKSFDTMVSMIHKQEHERDVILNHLSASEKRFREIIEDVSEIAIQGYDQNRNVTFWNSASEKLYLYTKEEAVGKKLEDLIIPEKMHEMVIKSHTAWLKDGGHIPSGELVLIDKNGNDVPVFSSHIINETQHGLEMFCIDVDMRPLKKSEAEREQLINKLKQAQKMEAIGTLAGGIAHDFNNILVPIIGYAELLQEETEDEIFLDGLNQIYVSATRAKELVQQILTFSRKETIKYQQIQVQGILVEVIKLLRSTIPHNINITHNIQPNCRSVKGDATQIHQIIMNIATNALYSIKTSGGQLDFQLTEETISSDYAAILDIAAGNILCLTISDTGTGIPQNVIDRIFDPFFTTKENGEGTGMGLSVVHGIIKNMDGSITVSSTLGSGTEIKIFLPITENEIDTPQINTDSDSESSAGSEKILLVDDEEAVLKVTQKALQKRGYSVIATTSPLEALDTFRESPDSFDMVISDVSMPRLTGDQLATELLKIQPDLPVILCTGFSDRITPDLIENLGITAIFNKPILLKELVRKIRLILDQTKAPKW